MKEENLVSSELARIKVEADVFSGCPWQSEVVVLPSSTRLKPNFHYHRSPRS